MAKILKAVIRKGGIDYQVNQNQLATVPDLKEAHILLINVAVGKDLLMSENEILDLGTSEEYDYIRVWYEYPPDPPVVEEAPREYFEKGYRYVARYLDQKLVISGMEAKYGGRKYYLPMEINDQPALELLDARKLKALLLATVPNDVGVIVPPAQLPDYEEAEAYIRDAADEYQKELDRVTEKQNKNAKAWEGWNDKGAE